MRPWIVAIVVMVIALGAVLWLSGRPGYRLAEPTPGTPANPANPPVSSAPSAGTQLDRNAQLKASAHSRITPSQPPLETRDGCVRCHTGPGFAKQTDKAAEVSARALGCNDCHDFAGTKEAKLRIVGTVFFPNKKAMAAGTAATCITCHNSRRDTSDPSTLKQAASPHHSTQGDMVAGTNAFEVAGTKYTNSVHTALADSCVACHMAPSPGNAPDAGGHSFRMTTKDGVQNLGACRPCHPDVKSFDRPAYGDYDGDGTLEGIQSEVEGLLKKLEPEILRLAKAAKVESSHGAIKFTDAAGKEVTGVGPTALQAAYNLFFVRFDGSGGIHNPAYAVRVLQSTYRLVTGQDVPGAALR